MAATGKIIGYARVSTKDQDLSLQLGELQKAGCEEDDIFQEKASGAKKDRPELKRMLEFVRKGDTVMVWKLDRLARSMAHLVRLVEMFNEKGIGFKVLTGGIDTTTKEGRLVFGIFASLAEFERELINERVQAGLDAARANGKHLGRPPITDDQISELEKRLKDGESWSRIHREMSIGRSTIARYAKALKEKPAKSNQDRRASAPSMV